MKSLRRVLGGLAAITFVALACTDDDISFVAPDAGVGGTGGSSGSGTGGSSGSAAGMGGANMAGMAGMAGSAVNGGSGGSGASGGSSGGGGSAGTTDIPDAGGDADVSTDSGVDSGPAPLTLAEVCANDCVVRGTWAGQSAGDSGTNCTGFDNDACIGACMGFPNPACEPYKQMIQCMSTQNSWYCDTGTVYPNAGPCDAYQADFGPCFQ